jgi:hypothetical protein
MSGHYKDGIIVPIPTLLKFGFKFIFCSNFSGIWRITTKLLDPPDPASPPSSQTYLDSPPKPTWTANSEVSNTTKLGGVGAGWGAAAGGALGTVPVRRGVLHVEDPPAAKFVFWPPTASSKESSQDLWRWNL